MDKAKREARGQASGEHETGSTELRPIMRRFSRYFSLMSILLVGTALLTVFQNCSGMPSEGNALYSSTLTDDCAGISCDQDMQYVKIRVTSGGFYVEAKPTPVPAENAACTGATCFDVAGNCDTGGYAGTAFYYQWILDSQGKQAEVKTTATCDDLGRFRFLVRVPTSIYDWNKSHTIRIFMKVIDSSGRELENAVGDSETTLAVVTRS